MMPILPFLLPPFPFFSAQKEFLPQFPCSDGTHLGEGSGDQFGPIDAISAYDILSVCLLSFQATFHQISECNVSSFDPENELISSFVTDAVGPPCAHNMR